jgi:hypothetical protein
LLQFFINNECWLLLVISTFLYAIPFILSDQFWWLIFLFPVPLLYLTRTRNLSSIHGYVWGCIVFALHMSGGIYLVACMAGDAWPVGLALGIAMVLYQALIPAFLFWSVIKITSFFSIHNQITRLCLWALALWFFIMWVDWYCLWIFGVQEGYPLMHPLILLAQQPALLCVLPILGKPLLTFLFLLISVSIVTLLWYRNGAALLFFCSILLFWLFCFYFETTKKSEFVYQTHLKSLPHMIYSTADDPTVVINIVAHQLQKIIAHYPETEVIILPESAFNVNNFSELSHILELWNEKNIGKAIHVIFGASRWYDANYYNSLHWVYNGKLCDCHDKKHAMLISERLSEWMNYDCLRSLYFNERQPITVSCDKRKKFLLSKDISFVPYVCSELFFNEFSDDEYKEEPIIAIVNDLLFVPYIQKILVLLARFKAIYWQRDIVYVSYTESLFIDRSGKCKQIN